MNNDSLEVIFDRHQGRPGALIHVLMAIQAKDHWLSKEALDAVSERLGVPLSRVMHIATFYKTFRLIPPGRHEVQVCTGTSCHVRGSKQVLDTVEDATGVAAGRTDPDGKFTIETGNCLGCCTLGPEVRVDGKHHGRIGPSHVPGVLKGYE